MANTFRTEMHGSMKRVYINEPWESEITVTEPFLSNADSTFVYKNGGILEITCANGSASYRMLQAQGADLETEVYRFRLIDSVWSLPELV